ncbi:MAG: flagellar hook-basal body complex protein [Sulfurimonas sp.]|uniref:flagellar hook-basal body complex protein n=1 Tax=Sulfurimonas sp. TaxID=2022749 RepID=UPI0025D418CB|nr:flagellar hook-basal body complex protein [Sulfurimonas sp.]MCK9491580.1 flagellar hook-basal body complex protein [Sulfurimonas sp.]
MMTQAFYTGISGLKSNQAAIDIVSDNIANISTIGFRGYRPEFSSIFEETLNATSRKPTNDTTGYGVMLGTSSMDKGQGSILLSDRSTDLAIVGNGWFGISGSADTMYTRAGNFTFDVDSDLVTTDGHYVLGTLGGNINANNELTNILGEVKLGNVGTQEKLRFPKDLTYPPEPSTMAKFSGNIGTEDGVQTIGAGVVDPQNNKNHLKLSFTKIIPQVLPGSQWDVVATTQTLDGTEIYDTKTGRADFDASGGLISTTLSTIDNNGAQINIDMGSGFDGVVAISNLAISASSISDGTIGGDLRGYSINRNAEVIATFTNGMQSSVGKIAVYHFVNEQGLERASGANFRQTNNSGEPLFYTDASGQNIIGTDVVNFNLENSNVRMDVALTDLIILQRSYDANSKSVTTADQMMQKALQMDA